MKIFAHRGASHEAKENSLEAFKKAIDLGVDGIEIDCLLTKDKVPVVTHNDDLSILFSKSGFVREKTWDQIQGLGLPTLTQALELLRNSSRTAILDIKAQRGLMFESPYIIAGLALEILAPEQILLSSFYGRHLLTLKKHFPHVARGLIIAKESFKLVPISFFDRFFKPRAIHPFLKWTSAAWVDTWHQKGFKVHAWVANTKEEIEHCVQMGVDGIFTDDPRLAKKWLMKDQN